MERKAIFFDRDGVVNYPLIREGLPFSPRLFEEFKLIPSITEVMKLAKSYDFLCFIVTNQPDISRKLMSIEVLEQIHTHIRGVLPVDEIFYCPHDRSDECHCRKPKPGMLLDAASKYSLNLNNSLMVGDRTADILAGKAAGCRTVFVDYKYAEPTPEGYDYRITTIDALKEIILKL